MELQVGASVWFQSATQRQIARMRKRRLHDGPTHNFQTFLYKYLNQLNEFIFSISFLNVSCMYMT